MQLPLRDKIIVITGGGGLIGSVFVRAIVENGGVAVVTDLNIKAATTVNKEIADANPDRVQFASTDITNIKSTSGKHFFNASLALTFSVSLK